MRFPLSRLKLQKEYNCSNCNFPFIKKSVFEELELDLPEEPSFAPQQGEGKPFTSFCPHCSQPIEIDPATQSINLTRQQQEQQQKEFVEREREKSKKQMEMEGMEEFDPSLLLAQKRNRTNEDHEQTYRETDEEKYFISNDSDSEGFSKDHAQGGHSARTDTSDTKPMLKDRQSGPTRNKQLESLGCKQQNELGWLQEHTASYETRGPQKQYETRGPQKQYEPKGYKPEYEPKGVSPKGAGIPFQKRIEKPKEEFDVEKILSLPEKQLDKPLPAEDVPLLESDVPLPAEDVPEEITEKLSLDAPSRTRQYPQKWTPWGEEIDPTPVGSIAGAAPHYWLSPEGQEELATMEPERAEHINNLLKSKGLIASKNNWLTKHTAGLEEEQIYSTIDPKFMESIKRFMNYVLEQGGSIEDFFFTLSDEYGFDTALEIQKKLVMTDELPEKWTKERPMSAEEVKDLPEASALGKQDPYRLSWLQKHTAGYNVLVDNNLRGQINQLVEQSDISFDDIDSIEYINMPPPWHESISSWDQTQQKDGTLIFHADSFTKHQQGLQYSTENEFPKNAVMLFHNTGASHWHMNNCNFPIDIIFLNENMRVLGIYKMEPTIGSARAPIGTKHALETHPNWAEFKGINIGDIVLDSKLAQPRHKRLAYLKKN